VPGTAETGDQFDAAIHLADLNKNGKAEAIVGVPTATAACGSSAAQPRVQS
jgi:hypothetical protein